MAAMKRARPPVSVISWTVSAPRSALRPTTITVNPSSASRLATARPRPAVAPVTRAVIG